MTSTVNPSTTGSATTTPTTTPSAPGTTMTSTATSPKAGTTIMTSTGTLSTARAVTMTSTATSSTARATSKATLRTTDLPITKQPFRSTPKPIRPTACYLCDGPPFICEARYKAHQCQSVDQQFCVTTIHNNDDGTRSVFRSCGTETGCREANRVSSDSRCRKYDSSQLYLDNFQCSWCCNTALCNNGTVPYNLYSP